MHETNGGGMTKRKHIAVLGGAGGIGRALVEALVQRGDSVVVLDLPASLERHPPKNADAIPVDILSDQSVIGAVDQLTRRVEKLEGFVNLAGYNADIMPLAKTSISYFDDVLAGNLRGAFLATRAILPLMGDGSAIVTTASGLAHYIRPGHGAYAAAKAGVIAMSRTFALELAPRIRVNIVAPGMVDTAFVRGGTGRSGEEGENQMDMTKYNATIPFGRIAQPDDIVGPILFLLDDASRYMTGQVLWVNGGAYMP